MDPFTIAMLAGTGINAIGKLMSGSSSAAIDRLQSQGYETQAKVYDTRAQVDNLNTDLLNQQADVAGMGVDFAASKERQTLGKIAEAGRQTLSAQRSYFAGNNLDPTFGSPLLVQAMTAGRVATDMDLAKASFAIDKANALSNEATLRGQAAGSAGQGLSDMLSASAARIGAAGYTERAHADMTAGYFGAATSLLSGVGGLGKGGFSMPTLNLTGFGFNPISGAAGQ